jgi:prepilin-type N-terminal cleavage/methylation domain-containing protein
MLTGRRRQGFTLVELMIAIVITVMVLGTIHRSVLVTQRAARAQSEQLALQSGVRGAVLLVLNELRELSTAEGGTGHQNDILSASPGSISYRAMRGLGFSCTPSTSNQLQIGRAGFSGFRDPQPGRDSLLLYADSTGAGSEAGWIPLPITSVSTTTACPGSAPGITLTTSSNVWLTGKQAGLPVRIYEPMELKVYQSEGQSWLGTRSISAGEAIQPLFGPLSNQDGFRLGYLDRAGRPTAVPSAVGSITVRVHAVGQTADEELTGLVILRNAAL